MLSAPSALVGALVALVALLVGVVASISSCSGSPVGSAGSPTPATAQGRLSARVQQALQGSRASSQVTYDASVGSVAVVLTLTNYTVPGSPAAVARTQEFVKTLCFAAQQATWTSSEALSQVAVSVRGPQYDDYADVMIRGYGGAILLSATATHLEWARLSADTAWTQYDQTWLSSTFRPFQQWWETPTSTATPLRRPNGVRLPHREPTPLHLTSSQ